MTDVTSTCRGLRIVNLTSVVTGPMATLILAPRRDMVKIERPLRQDDQAHAAIHRGKSTVYLAFNRHRRTSRWT